MNFARQAIRRIAACRSGVAMTEFALSLPFLLTAGLYGAEVANYSLVMMKVNQVAIHLADNASRIGDTSTITNRKIFEGDINDLLAGSNIQGGPSLNFYEHGRAIVSSLEVFDSSISCTGGVCGAVRHTEGAQFIHWQRCKGKKRYNSSYGNQLDAMPSGIGPSGEQVTAEPGNAVIFVEVAYDYTPMISIGFVGTKTIKAVSSFVVRDNIDLSGLKQRNPMAPDTPAECGVYSGFPASMLGGSDGGSGGASSGSSGGASSGGSSSSGGGSSSSSSSTSSGGSSSSSGSSSTSGGSSSSTSGGSGGSSSTGGRGGGRRGGWRP